ncbi:glycoside hydrolase family 27 protein [Zhouia amylolytica]|uniref:glycoside hydrolase family 27 protein n=1 Tax=Zhouia amylolytica TaxID=376730 RepID=UPI0020CD1456|nr:glycoside hydrolase family 27 protein [Zhouia amylolytica]MCQ0111636.1 glycoside hydrolase family 27 protein [Zhouia amylolytica]
MKLYLPALLFTFVFIIACNPRGNRGNDSASIISTHETGVKDFNRPMMGWASWNAYRINISEEIIQSQADAMVSLGLDTLGYEFINIDDGYFGGRDENGALIAHPVKFPNGMKALSDYIHNKGLKAGIYTDAGINTCASYWDKDTIGTGMGLYGHEYNDLSVLLNKWNYDYLKVDWCGGQWMGLDEQTRYTEIGGLIAEIKPEVLYNVCRWKFPGKWVTQVADSWRISGDIANNFNSILHIIDQNADLWKYASNGHYNDMDILQVGRGMTYDENKVHFSMWSMMHSPLILGNDLTKMNEETLQIISNKEIIALNQSSFVYQARRVVDHGELEIWAKPLVSTVSGEVAVGLLNRSAESANITLELAKVGINSSKGYTMRDLWEKKDYPVSKQDSVTMEVPGHGIVVLKIEGTAMPFNVFQYDDKE